MLCHVFWSQVEYKIICFILERVDIEESFCLSPFSDTGKPNKRFINIKNHVFGHSMSFVLGSFLHKSLKMVMPYNQQFANPFTS